MNRAGEFLILSDGARTGNIIWVDTGGSYEVNGQTQQAEFFFHREKSAVDGSTIIRCKKWRR